MVLDATKLQNNIKRMQQKLSPFDVALRPHVKTCKSIDVARIALTERSKGITVSTLKEAEYFIEHGINDILYAVAIVPNKLAQVAELQRQGANITIILDSLAAAEAIRNTNVCFDAPLPVLIEIDSDGHRSGLRPDDEGLLVIGEYIDHADNMLLQGVMTHAGSSYDCTSVEAIKNVAAQERDAILLAAKKLKDAALPCPVVSVGSTPTVFFAEKFDDITEVRAGVYMFFDLVMAGLGVCNTEDIALSVLCSVIGHQQDKNWIICDAGWMAMSRDRGTQKQKQDHGYGLVCDLYGKPIVEDLIITAANQEHGIVSRRDNQAIDFDRYPIGTLLRILPNHACATAAQHNAYHVVQGSVAITNLWQRFGGW